MPRDMFCWSGLYLFGIQPTGPFLVLCIEPFCLGFRLCIEPTGLDLGLRTEPTGLDVHTELTGFDPEGFGLDPRPFLS